ncbi:MAG: hypothetical protein L0226_09715 [Acidobacteria bacterium]|nr:hypothetical protein [Acidobacteriota bacterium]
MKRNRMIWLMCGFILAVTLSLIWLPVLRLEEAQAEDGQINRVRTFHCHNSAVSGRYSYHLTGSLAGVGPVAVIGSFTQNYDGSFVGQHSAISFNGQIVQNLPYSGTFSLGSDCVATGSFTDATGLKVTFKYVVMDQGDELRFLNTDAGNVLSGVAKRVD